MFGELLAHVFRDVGHLGEFLRAAHIHPVPELLHAHLALTRRDTDAGKSVRQFVARQANQRGFDGAT